MAINRAAVLVASALLIGGGYYAWREHGANQTEKAKTSQAAAKPVASPVTVASVRKGDFPLYLQGLGTAQAFNAVTVRTRVDGTVVKIAFKEGDIVKEGDLLAQIDPRPFQATVDQMKSKKTQDEATLANANLDLQRYTTLGEKNFAARQQIDTQRSLVAQLTAQVAADQAQIDAAQVQLGYTTIRAPLTGRTGFRLVDQGNIVNASSQTGIVTIQQVQPMSVVFTAPEEETTRIHAAMNPGPLKILALTTDKTQTLSTGTLSVINNAVDTTSGTIRLKATFENKDNALWPGLSVVTQLLVNTLRDVTIAPADAVQHGPNGLFAYVVDDQNKAHAQPIEIAQSSDKDVVVTKGLSPDDRVVVAGQYRVQDGTLVSIRTAQAATNDTARGTP